MKLKLLKHFFVQLIELQTMDTKIIIYLGLASIKGTESLLLKHHFTVQTHISHISLLNVVKCYPTMIHPLNYILI